MTAGHVMARLEVITGPMFSGKTGILINKLERATHADQNVLVIKPQIDTRSVKKIASRKKRDRKDDKFEEFSSFPAHEVSSAKELIDLVSQHQPNVLAVDEAQFFPEWFLELVNELLDKFENSDFTIIASGLDMDAWKKPFGIMPQLMAIADEVIKLTAICFNCKKPANLTYKKAGNSDKLIEVGDSEKYGARCRICHKLP
jgi:thymidine kinase